MNFINLIKNVILNDTRIFLGILVLAAVLHEIVKRLNKKRYNVPPGPIGLPILGYLPFLGSYHHITLHKLSKRYGNFFSLYLGQTLTVFCNDWPSAVEALSKEEIIDRPDGVFDDIPNGFGFTGSNGKVEWQDSRRLTVKTMKNVGLGRPEWDKVIEDEVEEIIEEIRKYKGQVVDMRKVMYSTFTNNLQTLVFGERLPSNNPATLMTSKVVDAVTERFKLLTGINFLPKLFKLLFVLGLYGSKTIRKQIYDFGYFMEKYINMELEKNKDNEDVFVKIYQKDANSYPLLKKTSIYANIQGILFAGSETSRSGMVWLLLAVTENPDVQKKVQEELDSVLGKEGKLKWSERNKVPYTYAAILESLRWKTLLPINGLRIATADIKIQGYDVPKGTVVAVNQWAVHNDTNYWSEPEKYDPQRFLTKDGKLANLPESYLPFSLGKRNCPGQNIALMEIFEYFVSIMKNFTLLPPEGGMKYDECFGLTYQAKNMNIRLISRDEIST